MKLKQLKKVSDCFVCNCLQCSKVMQLKCTVFIKIICTGVHQRAKKKEKLNILRTEPKTVV